MSTIFGFYFFFFAVTAKGTLLQGYTGAADTYNYQYSILTRQLLLASKLLYTLKEQYYPYLFAGLGAGFNEAYNYSSNINSNAIQNYGNNMSTSFSYGLGVGVDVYITSQLRLGMGYCFVDLGEVNLGNAFVNTESFSGLSQSHFYTNQLLVQCSYIFV